MVNQWEKFEQSELLIWQSSRLNRGNLEEILDLVLQFLDLDEVDATFVVSANNFDPVIEVFLHLNDYVHAYITQKYYFRLNSNSNFTICY